MTRSQVFLYLVCTILRVHVCERAVSGKEKYRVKERDRGWSRRQGEPVESDADLSLV